MKLSLRPIPSGPDLENGGDPLVVQAPFRWSRRATILAALGIVAYALAMLRGLPAAIVLPSSQLIVDSRGTAWDGEAVLTDGSRLAWHWAPLRSLFGMGFASDWTLSGSDVDLSGRALLGPRFVAIDETRGKADGAFLSALAPDLPFVCDMPLLVLLDRATLVSGARELRGAVNTGAGNCMLKAGGNATIVPPLFASFTPLGKDSEIRIAPTAERRRLLVTGLLNRNGHLTFGVTRDGGRMLPFAAPPSGLAIETDL